MHSYKFTFALLLALVTVPAMAQVNTQGKNHEVPAQHSALPASHSQVAVNAGGKNHESMTSRQIQDKVQRLIAQRLADQQQPSCCQTGCTKHNAEQEALTESELIEAETKLQHIRDTKDPQASFQKYPELLQRKPTQCHCECHNHLKQAQTQEAPSTEKKQAVPNDSFHTRGAVWERKVGI